MLEVLLFGTNECGSCSLNETRIKDVLKDFPEVQFRHLDVEKNAELVKKYQVITSPTIVIANNGEKMYEIKGIIERDRFHRELEYLKYKALGII
ncbi:MAG: thioredoxin family protein [Bacilli bacterium]